MTVEAREARTAAADARCAEAFAAAGCPASGVALVAVGGYGRRELAPYSDLDLVLVHEETVDVQEAAGTLWYPLWDSGPALDHAVRTPGEVVGLAAADLRVALGLLDLRLVAGDPDVALRLRSAVLAQWRSQARRRLDDLHRLVLERTRRAGELADVAVPDLKECAGGLRDATTMKALAAAWLVDVPHSDLERCRRALLDARDLLHDVAGRRTDRVSPELWAGLVGGLGLSGELAAQRHVRGLGRRVGHLSALTWRRARAVQQRPRVNGIRRPQLESVAEGVAVCDGEVVLAPGARPTSDPVLLLRAAAAAAERGVVLAPHTAARLVRQGLPLPQPWPAEARRHFVSLLGTGNRLRPVWETLDETGALDVLLPEWAGVRLLPHATPVHRYTVDRHLVETCVAAARLTARVERPDLLLVAGLLHDIGKGTAGEHSRTGEPVARAIALRMGFPSADAEVVGRLVLHHLLLPRVATTRDLGDPRVLALVGEAVRDDAGLALLAALTEADARATGEQAWTRWRQGLVGELVAGVRTALQRAATLEGRS